MKKENEAEITWDEIVKRHAEYMNSKNKLEKIMFVTILIRFIIFCRKKPKWSSSKKSVATVSKKGKVVAKKAGSATITAKIGKKKYKCKVKVSRKKQR